MPRSVNQVLLVGELSDILERDQDGGGKTCRLMVTIDETYTDRNGHEVDDEECQVVKTTGSLAEKCVDQVTVGALVYVEGKIETRDDLESGARGKVEVHANDVQFVDGDVSSGFTRSPDPVPDRISTHLTRKYGPPVDSGHSDEDAAGTERTVSGSTSESPSSHRSDSSSSSSTSSGYSSPFPPPRSR